jgi:predicted MFS family arabinose efflux permease
MPPLRLSGLAMLAFVVPLWVLPFLPPWPVVFAALFAAMFCTPLINGPLIAVLTSRTPDELRALAITAVITLNTLAAPVGFLIAGQVLEHWGVVPLFTAVVAGVTWMAIVYGAIVLRYRDVDAPVAEPAAS